MVKFVTRKTVSAFVVVGIIFMLTKINVANADITETRIEYQQGESRLVGFLYSDSKITTAAPGVLVFSDWMGVGPFAKERGRELAAHGYRAFVADIYGDGHQAADQKEAGQLATKFKSDRKLMKARAEAALQILLAKAPVNPAKVGAIGFCFGGTVALELARDGAPLAGVVSFHGGLDTPDSSLAKNIKGRILALHGADDPLVTPADVAAFEDEMRKGGVSWELVKYGNAVHAFTNPAAGNDNSKGIAFNELAAKRAFRAMGDFFQEIF